MLSCPVYATSDARIKRAVELGMCSSCSSLKHKRGDAICLGTQMKLKYPCNLCPFGRNQPHITAFHTNENVTINNHCIISQYTQDECTDYGTLLPSITVDLYYGSKRISCVRTLLDSGSTSNYIAPQVRDKLTKNVNESNTTIYNVHTYLGSESRSYQDFICNVIVGNSNMVATKFLVNENFSLDYEPCGVK